MQYICKCTLITCGKYMLYCYQFCNVLLLMSRSTYWWAILDYYQALCEQWLYTSSLHAIVHLEYNTYPEFHINTWHFWYSSNTDSPADVDPYWAMWCKKNKKTMELLGSKYNNENRLKQLLKVNFITQMYYFTHTTYNMLIS